MHNIIRNTFCLIIAMLMISAAQTQARLVVTTDTETSLELRWVGLTSEPFNSDNWNVDVEVIEPPPNSNDFPYFHHFTIIHSATPHQEGGHGTAMNVTGYHGGFAPGINFPAIGQKPYIFEEALRIHDSIGENYHIDKTVLSGTRVFSELTEKRTFLLESEHLVVPKTSLPTDLNDDNIVDDKDLNLLLSSYIEDGPGGGNPTYNLLNLDALLFEFGTGPENASTVPEPASMLLLLFGALGILGWRRRK